MKNEHETEDTLTLVVADDHTVVRKGLQAIFEITGGIKVHASVGTGFEAVAAAKLYQPKVVLLDLLMPDQPATVTIEQIKNVSPNSQVVILTSHEGEDYIAQVLQAGALSYILKDIAPEELIEVLHKAASGESMLNARVAKEFVTTLSTATKALHNSLTEREWEVLRFIALGLSNSQIAEKMYISEPTVKSHVSSILAKLYLTDRTKVAVYAWEKGLVKK
ncbi:response regulator transcription factor [Desulfovibrio sp. OttesenSCG-928-F07]|nr:response regulator transcription factor [Desulfovibrio sp. OttesenSCG-928-F07]